MKRLREQTEQGITCPEFTERELDENQEDCEKFEFGKRYFGGIPIGKVIRGSL